VLEILFVIYLCKRIRVWVERKGQSAFWFQVLLIVAWIVGELVGGVTGLLLFSQSGEINFSAYLCAITGAFAGAGAMFLWVHNLRAAGYQSTQRGFPLHSHDHEF
jgi:hypothetical protein